MNNAWFMEVLINSQCPTFHLFGYKFTGRVLIVDSKFLSRTLSLVISDMLYHLSNAVQQFLELWILDDITANCKTIEQLGSRSRIALLFGFDGFRDAEANRISGSPISGYSAAQPYWNGNRAALSFCN